MDSPEQGEDAQNTKSGLRRRRLEFLAGDHLDAGRFAQDPTANRPLNPMEEVTPVKGNDGPAGTRTGKLAEGGPPLLGIVEMVEKTQGENERKSAVAERQALNNIAYYSYRNM